MQTVAIADLIAHVAEYLALVKQGETIAVTENGRCVATVVPNDDQSSGERTIERVRREWGTIRPTHALLDVQPLPAAPGERPLSELLIEERENDWR